MKEFLLVKPRVKAVMSPSGDNYTVTDWLGNTQTVKRSVFEEHFEVCEEVHLKCDACGTQFLKGRGLPGQPNTKRLDAGDKCPNCGNRKLFAITVDN